MAREGKNWYTLYYMQFTRRLIVQMVFFAGLFLMLLGIAFLLGTMSGISRISVLGSFLFVIIGAVFAIIAIKLNKRAIYFFCALFSFQIGLFLLLSALQIIPVTIAQGWPLLSVFAGLSLFPAGWRHYRKPRSGYLIPSLAFCALGCVMLIFSFKVVSFSFKRFMIDWWPLLLILAGLVLVFLTLSPSQANGHKDGA